MNKLLILLFICVNTIIYSQEKKVLKIYSFAEVEKLHKVTPKPIVVFIYTDWCNICHGMDKNTFTDNKVITLLNKSFYFIKLDGEEKKDITFLGKKFVYKPSGVNTGSHELAIELATIRKRVSYPTTTILDNNFTIAIQLKGFRNKKEMKSILTRASKKY
ncbi:MAG: DUF255 domain-containing protein [Flavobacteriaceae bacterium]